MMQMASGAEHGEEVGPHIQIAEGAGIRARISSFADDESDEIYGDMDESEEEWEDAEEETQEVEDGERRDSDLSGPSDGLEMPKAQPEWTNGAYEGEREEESEYPALSVSEKGFDMGDDDYIPKQYMVEETPSDGDEESAMDKEKVDEVNVETLHTDGQDSAKILSHSLSFRAGCTVNGDESEEVAKEAKEIEKPAEDVPSYEPSAERLVSLKVRSLDRVHGVMFDDDVEEEEEGEEDEEEKQEQEESMKVAAGLQGIGDEGVDGQAGSDGFLNPEKQQQQALVPPNRGTNRAEGPSSNIVSTAPETEGQSSTSAVEMPEATIVQQLSTENGLMVSNGNRRASLSLTEAGPRTVSHFHVPSQSKGRLSEESDVAGYDYDSDDDINLRPPGCFAVCHVMVETMKQMGIKK